MLHVGLPAMRDGRRPEVRTPGITQNVSRETVAVFHGGAVRPARAGCGRRRPRPVDGRRQLLRGARPVRSSTCTPACYTLGRLAAGPDAWTCRMCQMFHGEPQAMLGGPPRASKPRGSPGWADRGRAPRLTPAESDTQRPGRPWGCSGVPLQRPLGCIGCFTWNRMQCPGGRRIRTPGLACLTKEVRRRSAIGARRSGPPGFTWNRAGLQLLVPQIWVSGRAGCFTWNRRQRRAGRRPQIRTPRPDVS
jgi:hypothetical protein